MKVKATTRDNTSITLPIGKENPKEAIKEFFRLTDLKPERVAALQKV